MTSEVESSALTNEEPTANQEEQYKQNNDTTSESIDTNNSSTATESVEQSSDSNQLNEVETIVSEEITQVTTDGINYSVPQNQNGFKSWMPYTALSKSSPNYKLLLSQGYVDENGLWRIQDYYCVALGSYYSKQLGDIFEATLSNGNVIKLIAVDHKADIHTDSTNRVTITNGCMSEFIVDRTKLNSKIKTSGSVSILPELQGTFVSIQKIGNIYN